MKDIVKTIIIVAVVVALCLAVEFIFSTERAGAGFPSFETFRCYNQVQFEDWCYRMVDHEFGRVCYLVEGAISCFEIGEQP